MSRFADLLDNIFGVRVVARGPAAGLRLGVRRADPSFAQGIYEEPVQEALAAHLSPGDVFYDVGANIGFYSLLAARCVGAGGRVYAFEPVSDNAAAIRRSARLNHCDNLEVLQEAVGAVTGPAQLILARHIGGAALATAPPPPDARGSRDVHVVTLDDAVRERGLRPPSLVKIDVEGAELDVLRGMPEILRTHRPTLIYEIDDVARDALDRKARAAAEYLSAAGYRLGPLPASYPNQTWFVEHVLARPE